MKVLTHILVGFVALAAAGTAAAQAARAPEVFKPVYIGGSIGISNFNLSNSDFPDNITINGTTASSTRDGQSTGYQAFGGWRFNKYLAVEGGYTWLGEAKVQYTAPGAFADVTYKDQAWTLAGMGTLPFDYGLSLFGQMGVAWHYTKTQVSGQAGALPISDGATDNRAAFLWGVGAGWDFNPSVGLRMQYQNFGNAGSSSNTGSSTPNLFSGSVIVRF
jgi:opacity protein-like surface antigen